MSDFPGRGPHFSQPNMNSQPPTRLNWVILGWLESLGQINIIAKEME